MIIFTGPPGSGKSTQARRLAEYMGWRWLSVGELLRSSLTDPADQKLLGAGQLVPSKIMIAKLGQTLEQTGDTDRIVLDGSLRTIEEAQWMVDQTKAGRFGVEAIINIVLADDTLKTRLTQRGRNDDSLKTIDNRLKIFHSNQNSILALLKSNGLRVVDINGEASEDKIFEDIKQSLGDHATQK